jgi:hypothetical protein
MSAEVDIQHVRYTNVNDAQEALVPLLEFALVENLDRNDG